MGGQARLPTFHCLIAGGESTNESGANIFVCACVCVCECMSVCVSVCEFKEDLSHIRTIWLTLFDMLDAIPDYFDDGLIGTNHRIWLRSFHGLCSTFFEPRLPSCSIWYGSKATLRCPWPTSKGPNVPLRWSVCLPSMPDCTAVTNSDVTISIILGTQLLIWYACHGFWSFVGMDMFIALVFELVIFFR